MAALVLEDADQTSGPHLCAPSCFLFFVFCFLPIVLSVNLGGLSSQSVSDFGDIPFWKKKLHGFHFLHAAQLFSRTGAF